MTALFHWIPLVLGLTSPNGAWYLFWSGFMPSTTVFAGAGMLLRKQNCHVHGCWRVGLLSVGEHRVCRKHHPDPPTHAHIIRSHRES